MKVGDQEFALLLIRAWKRGAALRAEFLNNFGTYAAYWENAARGKIRGAKLAELVMAAAQPDGAAPERAGLSIEQLADISWRQNPALQREFRGNFLNYAAFRKAEAAGRVRICGGETRR